MTWAPSLPMMSRQLVSSLTLGNAPVGCRGSSEICHMPGLALDPQGAGPALALPSQRDASIWARSPRPGPHHLPSSDPQTWRHGARVCVGDNVGGGVIEGIQPGLYEYSPASVPQRRLRLVPASPAGRSSPWWTRSCPFTSSATCLRPSV